MKRKLDIINIDGIPGIGVSSQITLLNRYFNKLEVYNSSITNSIDSMRSFVDEANLHVNDKSIVICDGSIAQGIQIDYQNGIKADAFEEKYGEILRKYKVMSHKYGVANILITMDDIEECKKRVEKRDRLLNIESKKIDFEKEASIINGLKNFDNYTFTANMKFYTINIDKEDTMLEIHDEVIKILNDNFEIKKPLYRG